MKTKNENSQTEQPEENLLIWIFSPGGVLFQNHNETEYQNYLKENYRSKTSLYQYLRSF
jgi:hypothetical protein